MTINCESFSASTYGSGVTSVLFSHVVSGATRQYPGLLVGVSIFGSATVSSIFTDNVDLPQELIFVRADDEGTRRSEIWYLPNLDITGAISNTFDVLVTLSASSDVVAGASVYNYFGGIGAHDGVTGTSQPLAESPVVRPKVKSILFSNFCINEAGGAAPAGAQNNRWNVVTGSPNHGLGSDIGPFEIENDTTMIYQTTGTPVWAMSVAELLNYQSNPPAIMGM